MSEIAMIDEAAVEEPVVEEPIVVPKSKTKQKKQAKPKKQPPYAVIVHNDPLHTFPYVIELLQKVCGHTKARAVLLTWQVHLAGRAVVWTGALEVAELKRDQIRGYGPDFYAEKPVKLPLGVTLEPMSGD